MKLKVVDTFYLQETDDTIITFEGITLLNKHHYLLTSDGIKHRITGCNFPQIDLDKQNKIMIRVSGKFDYSEAELI